MRFSIYSLFRLACLVLAVAGSTGIMANRLVERKIPSYKVDNAQPWSVSGYLLGTKTRKNSLILDMQKDRQVDLKVEKHHELDMVSFSPFIEKYGQREAIARRKSFSSDGIDLTPGKIEMVRVRYPSGEVADSRELDWLPNSLAAWDVDTSRGLSAIFSTGAGYLMRLDWTDERGSLVHDGGRQIAWAVDPPFGVHTFLAEPSWVGPESGFAKGLMVASIWGIDSATRDFHVGLVWLQLDKERESIVNYGLIVDQNLGQKKNLLSYRHPMIRGDSAGMPQLFWMEKSAGQEGWSLKTAAIRRLPDQSGLESMVINRPRELVMSCKAAPMGFGPGLSWVYYVVADADGCYDNNVWRKVNFHTEPGLLLADGLAGKVQRPDFEKTR